MIQEFGPEALVVVSADAVYKLDYREVVEEHLLPPPTSGSELTPGSVATGTSL